MQAQTQGLDKGIVHVNLSNNIKEDSPGDYQVRSLLVVNQICLYDCMVKQKEMKNCPSGSAIYADAQNFSPTHCDH